MNYSFIGVIADTVGFLANLGVSCKPVGIEHNAFGTFLFTSVGNFGIEDGYAPLVGLTHTVGVMTICKMRQCKELQLDGTYKHEEHMIINTALDHRYMDGVIGSKMIKEVSSYFFI